MMSGFGQVASTIVVPILAYGLYRYILYPVTISPLAKIPNAHWSCSTSPLWILRARFEGRENRTLQEAHQTHGPVVRVGPDEISINTMDGVKTVYQGGFDKHSWYDVFNNYGVPNTFSSGPAKHHSIRKRMVSNVYSKSYIHSSKSLAAQSEAILNSRLLPMVRKSALESQAPHGTDVHSLFGATAMDFICAYCFGMQYGSNFIQNKLYRDHWLKLYMVRKGHGFFAQELPWLSWVLGCVGINLTPTWVGAANRELEEWCKGPTRAAVALLEESDPSTRDIADEPTVIRAIVAGIEKEDNTNGKESLLYSTAIIQRDLTVASEVIDHILAGQETTGVTLTYLSWHLSRSEDLQKELRKELLSLGPNMALKDGRVDLPDPKQLDALPILNAMITETIRIYAPAGGPEPRVVPTPSCQIGAFEVPGGTRVSASVFNIHRDEAVFPDPETWDHTRWLKAQDGDDGRRDVHRQLWGFSSGGRMCLGSNFATHELKLVIAAIYSNYSSHIVDDDGIEPTDAYTGHPKSGQLWLRFEPVA